MFEFRGIAVNPRDTAQAALADIYRMQDDAMMHHERTPDELYRYALASANWNYFGNPDKTMPAPEKTLDERFADFKVRLASAVARRDAKQ